jgi:hypothetical protein
MFRLVLFASLLLVACGGSMFDDTKAYTGRYLPDARLVLDPDPNALRPSSFESGSNWVLWLEAHRGGSGPLSETASRATVFIEFAAPPAIGDTVDLASAPLQLTYESGGQKIEYISRSARGTLVIKGEEGSTLVADLEVTFTNPTLGEGEKSVSGEIRLARFTDF